MSATTTRIARTWAIVLAVGLLGPPPALAAASPVHTGARVDASALEVRVEPATLDAELDRARVEERGRSVLERRVPGLEPGERIVVELAGDDHGYRVSVRAFRNGLPIVDQPASFEHEGSIDMLLIRVEARIEGAVNRLVAERERLARLQLPSAAQSDEETPRRRLRLRIPGALAAGLGASMIAGGALLTARGEQPAGNDLLEPTDLRPPGAVLMATGAALLVTGVSLLVVDKVRCRKRRASCDDLRPTLRWMTWAGGQVVVL